MTKTGIVANVMLGLALLSMSASSARAQTSDPAAAEALFDEGRRLAKEERFTEACAKFEASQRLDPGVGTLLNLGDCFERVGRTASAWARFREAASLAVASSQREREQAARLRAQALEPRLMRLAIRPEVEHAGLRIARDGVVLEPDAWGTAVPVDPGRHAITASAPGKKAWREELEVEPTPEGTTRVLVVPALESESVSEPSTWSAQRTVSVVTFGVGVAVLAAGTVIALDAKSSYDDARSRCTATGCSDPVRDQAMSAQDRADIATGLFIGGAVAVVAGVVLFVLAPRRGAAPSARAPGGLWGALDLRWSPPFAL